MTIWLSRIEIAFWNTIIPLLSALNRLRQRQQPGSDPLPAQAAAQICLWAAIGLVIGFALGLLGILAG